MKRILLCLLWASFTSAATLEERVDAVLASSPAAQRAWWGIQIVDPASGSVLYQRDADHFFMPASNTKLFSTALALNRLGPQHRFHTRVLAGTAPDSAGRLAGDLVLEGGGDPTLSARAVPYKKGPTTGNPLAAIEELADQVVARGVRRIEGDVVGDDRAWPWEPPPEGWAVDDTTWDYGAPVSALTLTDSTIAVTVRGGRRDGDPTTVSLRPPLELFTIDNRVRTASGEGPALHLERLPGSYQLRLWGTLAPHSAAEPQRLAVPDPALFAAYAFYDALTRHGVTVAGRPVARHRQLNEDLPVSDRPVVLAQRESQPLLEILRITNKTSQNLFAEIVLREVARVRRGDASRDAALKELNDFLKEAGLDAGSFQFEDGSGLSQPTLATPTAVTQLLSFLYRSEHRDAWISLLPVGGEDGTLSERFRAAPGRVRAKTGTLSHVSALSGYLETRDGRTLAFAIFANGYRTPAHGIREVIDRICLAAIE
jgi:serine-type D-Ala-D-Ala carboxypeptidase/endopeptidase (penicillin-binding protein 4)